MKKTSIIQITCINLTTETTLEQWAAIGRSIYHEAERLTWRLADWASFGEIKYGELKNFCELNGVNYGYLRNLAYVAGAVELSYRNDNLSFTHHIVVAPLNPPEQKKWLAIAEKEKLSVVELRRRVREAGGEFKPEKIYGPAPTIFEVEKFFVDADVFLERNMALAGESREHLWERAQPALEKMAKLWPEHLTLK